ncbi:MAG: dehydrogenase [Planctomycetes bacterium]|nr:dehydrogenase [Planctomycetota bacterium]
MPRAQALSIYRVMLVIRRAEERLARSHQQGLIHGACHTYIGEEAIAAGVCAWLRPDDAVFSTHRGHGHALAKGLDPRALIAELYGRESGCSRGRGGSMHLFAPEIGMMGTSGIVAPCILQAAGAACGFRLLGADRVAVAFFGDGAVNNGAFHEGLNLAGIWKLPVLFVCENNGFATEIPFAVSAADPRVAARGGAYGLPFAEVDGNDPFAVAAHAREAIERARRGHGATLLECRTYRTRPHAEGMGDFTYRTREEVERWKTRCPIARMRDQLIASGHADASDLDRIERDVAELIAESHACAERSPFPSAESVAEHVWARPASGPPRDPPAIADTPREVTFTKASLEALTYAMARDPRIFVMGEGIGPRGGNFATTAGLFAVYGEARLRDTPICERAFTGLAAGAAMVGARPVVDYMFWDFALDAVGEILNQIAKIQYMSSGRLRMPVVLRGCVGIGHSAATHHSGNYYSMFAGFPGLRVVVPSNPRDAKGLFATALAGDDPVLFFEHRELLAVKGPVPEGDYAIDFGQASIVREGHDLTIVALALMVHRALDACDALAREGISAELIDPRTIAPLDIETILASVEKTGRLLIIDEGPAWGGFAAEVAAALASEGFDSLDAPIRRLHGAFLPTPYSPTLEAAVTPTTAMIRDAARSLAEE